MCPDVPVFLASRDPGSWVSNRNHCTQTLQQSLPLGTRLVASTSRRGRFVPSQRRLSRANEGTSLAGCEAGLTLQGTGGEFAPRGNTVSRTCPLKHPRWGNPSWLSGPVKVATSARGHQRDSEPELTAQPGSSPGPVVPTSSAPSTPSSWVGNSCPRWRTQLSGAVSCFPDLPPQSRSRTGTGSQPLPVLTLLVEASEVGRSWNFSAQLRPRGQ